MIFTSAVKRQIYIRHTNVYLIIELRNVLFNYYFCEKCILSFLCRAVHVSTLATGGKRRVLFLFMNNAFAIGAAERVYIITIDAGAVIIARNAPRKILRFEVERSDILAHLRRSKGE